MENPSKSRTGNKTRSYVLYALGEIFLVVIGILLALQVNNWNENRKERQLEIKVLHEISSDLQEDILSLRNDIRLNNLYIQDIQRIQSALENNEAFDDSLSKFFARLPFNTTYTLKTSGYTNLQNRGFEIVANDSVRRAVTDLYDSAYSFLKETQTTADRLTYDVFTPPYIKYFKKIDSKLRINGSGRTIRYYPADIQKMKGDEEFKLLLDFLGQVKINNLYSIEIAFSQLRDTKKRVDEYLMELER